MSAPHVKYIGFGRFIDNILLYSYAHDKSHKGNIKKECAGLLDKLRLLGLASLERQKCNTSNGSWFCWIDQNEVVYMVLCDTKYPERQAYKLLTEVQEELEKLPDYQIADENMISKHAKKFMPSLMKKYDDLANLDHVYAAQTKADNVVNIMGTNVKNMLDNMGDLESLETKSSMMQDQARVFNKDATVLKKDMRKRAWKVKFLIFFILIAVVTCIVLGIVLHR